MKTRSCVFVILAVALSIGARSAASEAMKAIVGSYLEIHAALAADRVDSIKAPAQAIVRQAEPMGEKGAGIVKAARAVEQASDLEAARKAFAPLSDAVIAGAKAEGWSDLSDVKLAYCPMAKASWLQTGDKIRNPYYGSMMLECGEFRDRTK